MKSYFVTACGTENGKTFITTLLCSNLKVIKKNVQAIKPVISGWDNHNIFNNDTVKILLSLKKELTEENICTTSPWRLKHPLAPNFAARLENIKLDYKQILQFCQKEQEKEYEYLFIEGVGGLMSPITDDKTCFDLIKDLKIKIILIVSNYLGSITHMLTAMKILESFDTIIILNEQNNSGINIDDINNFVSRYLGKALYVQKYVKKQSISQSFEGNIFEFLN